MHEGTFLERIELLERELAARIAGVERRVEALRGPGSTSEASPADRLEALLGRLDRLERRMEARLEPTAVGAAPGSRRSARSADRSEASLMARLEELAERMSRMELVLEQQLLHARRVEAELVGVKRRVGANPGRGPTVKGPRLAFRRAARLAALPTPRSAAGRKLRKLIRDPEAFFADARNPALRALGSKLFER